jgi:hypothetical protein
MAISRRPDRALSVYVDDLDRKRVNVRPGNTGLSQVVGRDGIPFAELVKFDCADRGSRSLMLARAVTRRGLVALMNAVPASAAARFDTSARSARVLRPLLNALLPSPARSPSSIRVG